MTKEIDMRGDILSQPGRFGPLPANDPSIGRLCPICERPIEVGTVPTLIELGPADQEEADKKAAGRPYTAAAEIAHESCAYPENGT